MLSSCILGDFWRVFFISVHGRWNSIRLGVAGEISLEENFKATLYDSDLGVRALVWYYSTYLIPKGILFTTRGDSQAFEAPVGSIVLYKQALMVSLRFLVPLFFRESLLCFGLALRQLMPNAWWIAIGCMILWELPFKGEHYLTLNKFFHCYCSKEQEPGWFYIASWDSTTTLITVLPSSNSGWRSRYFFVLGEGWEYPLVEVPIVKFNQVWALVVSLVRKLWIYCYFSIFLSLLESLSKIVLCIF